MTRRKQAALWLLAAVVLVAASIAVNAEVGRKLVKVECKGGTCTIAESDLAGLVRAAEHLYQENARIKATCGVRGT